MKASLLLALAAASVNAESIATTGQECWNGEGAQYVDSCSDVYFFTCDVYEIFPGESCNVFTFSDSRLTWMTQEIKVYFWSYYLKQTVEMGTAVTADDFVNTEEASCYALSEIPEQYEAGKVMNYTDGMCGFKY